MSTLEPLSDSFRNNSWPRITLHGLIQHPGTREFDAVFCPEPDDGGFSVFALHYPGVISQGETLEECQTNIAEAFVAMAEAAAMRGERLRYSETPVVELCAGCRSRRITIDG